jgi:hypothetical protein
MPSKAESARVDPRYTPDHYGVATATHREALATLPSVAKVMPRC